MCLIYTGRKNANILILTALVVIIEALYLVPLCAY